jgi:hypothetical protein
MPSAELHFGLRRLGGHWKPARAVVRDVFAGRPGDRTDGGFEREHNGADVLGSWTAYDPSDGMASVVTAPVRHGSKSVCFSDTGGGPLAAPSVMQAFPVLRAGEAFAVSAYAYRRSATGFERIALSWFADDGRFLAQAESRPAVMQDAWERLSVSAAAPPGASYVQVHLKSSAEKGTACFDDVSVTR